MGKKILIAYGTENFIDTLKRIGKEAKKLGVFDGVRLYTPNDLPLYIKASPLMAFKKGGGYWLWKPYIIWKTLQDCKEDDIVVYVDAGCVLRQSQEWKQYLDQMENYNTILFHYREDFDYKWGEYWTYNSTKIKYWTKKSTLRYFDDMFQNIQWREYNKILGGFIITKGKNNQFIKEWLTISLMRPELIIDPFGKEVIEQTVFFNEHRHDQSIITPLAYFYLSKEKILILPETSESQRRTAAVAAERIRNIHKPYKTIIRFVKSLIGENLYHKLLFWRD